MLNTSFFRAVDKNLLTLFSTFTPFVFPNYQREYVWGDEEIGELIDDIIFNLKKFSESSTSPLPITFIGNLITININNTQGDIFYKFRPNNQPSMPVNSLYLVIDGQQRISTFSMIAMSLCDLMKDVIKKIILKLNQCFSFQLDDSSISKLTEVITGLNNDSSSSQLENSSSRLRDLIKNSSLSHLLNLIKGQKEQLVKFFSIHYSLYDPPFIPLCLREDEDKFEATAINSASNYKSPICNLQASFIFKISGKNPPSNFTSSSFYAFDIVKKRLEEEISRLSIDPNEYLNKEYFDTAIQDFEDLAEDIKLLRNYYLFSYYFRTYCYIVHIEALNLALAFDMFQSLNSTGAPLTSLEVFRPHVLSKKYSPNNSSQAFETIFKFVSDKDRENTIKRTNEIAITSALVYNGNELSRKFKQQVDYFKKIYDIEYDKKTNNDSSPFSSDSFVLETIDNIVDFYKDFWTEKNNASIINALQSRDDEAVTCLLFLRDSNHSISTSVLSLFYILYNNQQDFVDAIKATTAFYVLWRSVWGTSGLPEVYRDFLKTYNIYRFKYDSIINPTLADLKNHFINRLTNKGIIFPTPSSSTTNWIALSNRLNYEENKSLCKFCLFVYFNNQIAIKESGFTNGLMTKAAPTVNIYLKPDIWESKDLKELEHVAPQKQPEVIPSGKPWDSNIYQNNYQHDIGNLLLLPKEINISVSNRAFNDKLFYYKIIADKTMANRKNLIKTGLATNIGKKTANLLLNANYISGLEPFINLDSDFEWDLNFIKTRGEQIRQVVFERMWDWLK